VNRSGLKLLGVIALVASLLAVPATAIAAPSGHKAVVGPKTGEWQRAMASLRLPGIGCFTGSFPVVKWHRAVCKRAPRQPFEPPRGHPPLTVGDGANDYVAQVTGTISSATGSFPSVSAGATETGQIYGAGPQVANAFTLQLNTKPFTTPVCSTAQVPSQCQGWEQFVYDTHSNEVFIQFWLEGYNQPTCPSPSWATTPLAPGDCYTNSPTPAASSLPGGPLKVAALSSIQLTGSATAGGMDSVVLTTGAGTATASNVDSLLHLSGAWKDAEFAILGDADAGEANFGANTTLSVETTTHSGTKMAPTCVDTSYTGETNNLDLTGTPAVTLTPAPSITSEQTNTAGASPGSCAAAQGIGDTHLATFERLFYDFQASGDFTLATAGPKFVVQTQQVSGAPTWPLADVNQAIATRIGNIDVAVCSAPPRLIVGRATVNLPDGGEIFLPGGGEISRSAANGYLIRGANGDSVEAQINLGSPNWINTYVGLGTWPTTVRGLLASALTNADAVESSTGVVLPAPFPIDSFYNQYGDSWRVPAGQSMLSVCGKKVVSANSEQLFYADDLPTKLADRGRAECVATGVEAPALLGACTLDAVVLNTKAAAAVYRTLPKNLTLGQIILPPLSPDPPIRVGSGP
jgi:hypothetical protein